MSSALTITTGLDADLIEAIQSSVDFKLGGNIVQPDGKGGEIVIYTAAESFETWQLPALVDEDLKDRAGAAYVALCSEFRAPTVAALGEWLGQLGVLCSTSRDTSQNSEVVTAAYVQQLLGQNFPAQCFTSETLNGAAKQFEWFPAYFELEKYIEEVARPMRKTLERLKAVRDADERDLRGTFEYHTPDERTAYWAEKKARDIAAANARCGIVEGELDGLSHDEVVKAAYAKAGLDYPGPEKASWAAIAAAGMPVDDEQTTEKE